MTVIVVWSKVRSDLRAVSLIRFAPPVIFRSVVKLPSLSAVTMVSSSVSLMAILELGWVLPMIFTELVFTTAWFWGEEIIIPKGGVTVTEGEAETIGVGAVDEAACLADWLANFQPKRMTNPRIRPMMMAKITSLRIKGSSPPSPRLRRAMQTIPHPARPDLC